MMEQLGQIPGVKYSKKILAGAGTQTAALAFGGYAPTAPIKQQKNTMEHLGHQRKFKYSKIPSRRSRTTNSSLSFWWF
jgi:hypothetical protein